MVPPRCRAFPFPARRRLTKLRAPPPAATAPPAVAPLKPAPDNSKISPENGPGAALRGASAAPFSSKKPAAAPRRHVWLWLVLGILALVVGAESYYILTHDEEIVEANQQRPPMVVNNPNPAEKPTEITRDASGPQTPVVAFLQSFDVTVASGGEPRLFVNNQTFHLGEVVAPNLGLKWTHINDQTRELEFTDKQGHRYVKKF